MNRDIAAEVWAKNMGGTTIIKYLKPGQRFRFPKAEAVFVYRGRGWYSPENNQTIRYRTGIRTGVVEVGQLAVN